MVQAETAADSVIQQKAGCSHHALKVHEGLSGAKAIPVLGQPNQDGLATFLSQTDEGGAHIPERMPHLLPLQGVQEGSEKEKGRGSQEKEEKHQKRQRQEKGVRCLAITTTQCCYAF